MRTPAHVLRGSDVGCAILARLLFEGNDTAAARRDLRRLVSPILEKPLTWTTETSFGGLDDWALLNFALEAVGGKAAVAWQKTARGLVVDMQEGRETDTASRGSWDPNGLPGSSDGRVLLTTHGLGVLRRTSCYSMLIVEGPR